MRRSRGACLGKQGICVFCDFVCEDSEIRWEGLAVQKGQSDVDGWLGEWTGVGPREFVVDPFFFKRRDSICRMLTLLLHSITTWSLLQFFMLQFVINNLIFFKSALSSIENSRWLYKVHKFFRGRWIKFLWDNCIS